MFACIGIIHWETILAEQYLAFSCLSAYAGEYFQNLPHSVALRKGNQHFVGVLKRPPQHKKLRDGN